MLIAYSALLVNKNDSLYTNAKYIPEIENFETVVCHGCAEHALLYDNQNNEYILSSEMFAAILTNSPMYEGGDIRLVSCSTGSSKDGFAQQLADILHVKVIAPTETIWVNEYGEMFITNSDVIADLWYNGEKVNETGTWVIFEPRKEQHDIPNKV